MRVTQTRTLIPEPNSGNKFRFLTDYTLRSDGQPSQINHPSGTWYQRNYHVGYDYNPRTGQPEGLNELTGGETIVDTITRNTAGQVTAMTYGPAGVDGVASWTYDPHTLRLTEALGGTTSNAGAWQDLAYTYDGNGNITKIFDDVNANQWQCFAYDGLDRLIEAFTDNTSTCNGFTATGAGNYNDTYAYSVGGNIVSKTGNGAYTYGDPDHRHAVTATSDGSSYVYDDNGNMATRNPAGSPAQSLTWDKTQRLRTVTDTTGTTEFLYDVDGQRVRRKTGDVYTFYADGIEYEHDDATNTGTFTWYHQIAGRTVAYTKTGSTTTWMFQDQINSTGLTVDDAGNQSVQRYTPWGELRTDGNLTTDRHYTGQIADQSTGLSYYNARYYDPTIGRFVSPDALVGSSTVGGDLSRYAYVRNNPTRFNDPSGHVCIWVIGSCDEEQQTSGEEQNDSDMTSDETRDGSNDSSWWSGLVNAVKDVCHVGSDNCDGSAGWIGELKRNIVNGSGGTLQGMSGGLADDTLHHIPVLGIEEDDVDWSSGAAIYGELAGDTLVVRLELFSPTGRAFGIASNAVNAGVECAGDLNSYACAEGPVNTLAPLGTASATRRLFTGNTGLIGRITNKLAEPAQNTAAAITGFLSDVLTIRMRPDAQHLYPEPLYGNLG